MPPPVLAPILKNKPQHRETSMRGDFVENGNAVTRPAIICPHDSRFKNKKLHILWGGGAGGLFSSIFFFGAPCEAFLVTPPNMWPFALEKRFRDMCTALD